MNQKNLFLGFLMSFFLVAAAFTTVEVERYTADVEKSVLTWSAYKVTGSHTGTINLKSGSLDYTDGQLSGGSFVIDMTTIKVTDLEGEWAGKLQGHLSSDDFFGVEKFPEATFEVTRVVSRGTPGDYKVIGNLTIKETTKEVKFLTSIDEKAAQPVATAKITIDRSDFDIRYGSGSFFDNLGDKTIYDEFDLELSLVVNK